MVMASMNIQGDPSEESRGKYCMGSQIGRGGDAYLIVNQNLHTELKKVFYAIGKTEADAKICPE